jgi:hypothetical protein
MKGVIYLALALVTSCGTLAQAQTAVTSPGKGVVVGVPTSPGFYGNPYGFYGSSTAAEGFGRGLAEVIRSAGEYNLNSSAAAVNLSVARQQEIENHRRAVHTYFDLRDLNRQIFVAEQKRLRSSPEDAIRYSQVGKPRRLSPSELDSVTGEIRWPTLLTARNFSAQRIELEKAFSNRSYQGVLGAEALWRVTQLTDDMLVSIKSQVHYLPPSQYVEAKRFLQSLAYEAAQPAA